MIKMIKQVRINFHLILLSCRFFVIVHKGEQSLTWMTQSVYVKIQALFSAPYLPFFFLIYVNNVFRLQKQFYNPLTYNTFNFNFSHTKNRQNMSTVYDYNNSDMTIITTTTLATTNALTTTISTSIAKEKYAYCGEGLDDFHTR